MSRKPRAEAALAQRFQVTFHQGVAIEKEFLREWFNHPWGRRQAWARGLLSFGLQVTQASGARWSALVPAMVPARMQDSPAEAQQSQSVVITLRRESPEDAAVLGLIGAYPYTRRSGVLRDLVIEGLLFTRRLPAMLAALGQQPVGVPAHVSVPAPVPVSVPAAAPAAVGVPALLQSAPDTGDSGRVEEQPVARPAGRAPKEFVPNVTRVPETVAELKENPPVAASPPHAQEAPVQELSTAVDTHDSPVTLDIDLDNLGAATAADAQPRQDDSEPSPAPKRPELAALFQ